MGKTKIVELLLDRGARIDEVVPGDENALITACAAGRVEVVRLAANLEGTNSPIQKIIDQVPPTRPNSAPRAPDAAPTNGADGPLSLADRIRALQRTRT